jgi:hypothetical protein
MAPEDIITLTRRRPFEPFRIVTSDGTCYDIRHPEMTMVAVNSVIIGYPSANSPYKMMKYDIVSLMHLVRIEPLESAPSSQTSKGNGAES